MSNGGPDATFSNGLNATFHFVLTDPPKLMRWRTSVAAGPYSPSRLYGFDGKVPTPSVLLRARLSVYEPVSETYLFALEFTFTVSWFWLYKPKDSMRKTAPTGPSGNTPVPGTAGSYVPKSGALTFRDRSMCRPCEFAYVIATVVLSGSWRSRLMADW